MVRQAHRRVALLAGDPDQPRAGVHNSSERLRRRAQEEVAVILGVVVIE